MPERGTSRCDECLQDDDHPKLHYGTRTMHHDCAPQSVRRDVLDGAHSVHPDLTRAVFAAADEGIHGHDLVAHIHRLHEAHDG